MATSPGKPFWSKAGEKPLFPFPLLGEYDTGENTMGTASEMSPHNDDRASRIPDRGEATTAFHREAMSQGEAIGARLTISPSMKIPTTSPEATMAGSLKTVSSVGGRNNRNFFSGQDIGY